MKRNQGTKPSIGLAVVLAVFVGACPSSSHQGQEDGDGDGVPDGQDNCPGLANADQGDQDGDGVGDVCDMEPLMGWWVVELASDSADATWGAGNAISAGPGSLVEMGIEMASGEEPILELSRTTGGTLVGRWRGSASAVGPLVVEFQQSNALAPLVQGTLADGRSLTLHRAVTITNKQVGVWQSPLGGTPAILAIDVGWSGNQALFSLISADRDWPEEGHYSGSIEANGDPRIEGLGFSATAFQQGQRMYVCLLDWDTDVDQCEVYEYASEQSPLNGLWLGRFQTYQQDLPEWYATVVVEHQGALYFHDRDESLLDSLLTRQIRPVVTADGTFIDTTHGGSVSDDWSGHLSSGETRIVGRYDGWDEYYYSLERTMEPPSGWLTRDASSISADWFDAPAGIPEPILGSATMIQDGSRLEIIDHSEDGVTYRVEATWNGHEYVGAWWAETEPAMTSPWRGQLLANGWYLHGTWEKGEYSFSLAPFGRMEDATDPPVDTVVASPDAFKKELAFVHDSDDGVSVTLKRDQDRLSGMHVVLANGDVLRLSFDERGRPVLMEGPGDYDVTTLTWSSDSQSVEISVDDGWNVTTEIVTVDYDDQALLTALDQHETDTGADVSAIRSWISDNPGRAASILQGLEPPPSLELSVLDGTLVKHGDWNQFEGILSGVIWSGAGFVGAMGGMLLITTSTPLLAAVLLTAAYFGAAIVLGYFIVKLIAWFMDWSCDPCTLACFINCPP